MKLHELSPAEGSKKDSKRIGRGHGSGRAKLPVKVIRARRLVQAAGIRPGFEGGQMPLQRRIPKEDSTTFLQKM